MGRLTSQESADLARKRKREDPGAYAISKAHTFDMDNPAQAAQADAMRGMQQQGGYAQEQINQLDAQSYTRLRQGVAPGAKLFVKSDPLAKLQQETLTQQKARTDQAKADKIRSSSMAAQMVTEPKQSLSDQFYAQITKDAAASAHPVPTDPTQAGDNNPLAQAFGWTERNVIDPVVGAVENTVTDPVWGAVENVTDPLWGTWQDKLWGNAGRAAGFLPAIGNKDLVPDNGDFPSRVSRAWDATNVYTAAELWATDQTLSATTGVMTGTLAPVPQSVATTANDKGEAQVVMPKSVEAPHGDPGSPEMKEYLENGPGKYTVIALDTIAQTAFPPDWIAAAAYRGVKTAVWAQRVMTVAQKAQLFEDAKVPGTAAYTLFDSLAKADTSTLLYSNFVRTLGGTNKGALAAALGESKTMEDVALVVGAELGHGPSIAAVGARKDPTAFRLSEVQREADDLEAMLQRPKGAPAVVKPVLHEDKWPTLAEVVGDPTKWTKKEIAQSVAYLQAQDNSAARLVNIAAGSSTNAGVIGKYGWVEAGRARGMQRRAAAAYHDDIAGSWSVKTAGAHAGQMLYRVAQWPGGLKPNGAFNIKGTSNLNELDEITAIVQNTKALDDQPELKRAMVANVAASMHSDVDLYGTLHKFESDMIKAVAAKHGLDPASDNVQKLATTVRTASEKAVEDITGTGGFGIYRVGNKSKYQAVEFPLFESQVRDHFHLMDFNALDDKLANDAGAVQSLMHGTGETVAATLDGFNAWWKPLAVIKPSTSIASTIEASFRSMAVLHAMHMRVDLGKNVRRYSGATGRANKRAYQAEGDDMLAQADWMQGHADMSDQLLANHAAVVSSTGTPNAATPWFDHALDPTDIDVVIAERDEYLARAEQLRSSASAAHATAEGTRRVVKKGQNTFESALPNGEVIRHMGPFADPRTADARFATMSAQQMSDMSLGTWSRIREKQMRNSLLLHSTQVAPTDPAYWTEVAMYMNKHVRTSEIGRSMLRDDDYLSFLKAMRSKEGQKGFDLLNQSMPHPKMKSNIPTHYHRAQDVVHGLIPDEKLRALSLSREITPDDVRVALEGREDLIPVSGDLIAGAGIMEPKLYDRYQQFAGHAFKWVVAKPEDKVRTGLYEMSYRNFLQNAYAGMDIKSGALTNDMRLAIENNAARFATSMIKDNLYNVERRTNLAAAVGKVLPFANAMQNAVTFWSKTALNDPQFIVRMRQIYMAPQQLGVADKDGNINVPIDWIPGIPGDVHLTATTRGLLFDQIWGRENAALGNVTAFDAEGNTISAGILSPMAAGVSPLFTIPFSEAVKHDFLGINTVIDADNVAGHVGTFLREYTLPFGPSKELGSLDLLFPAYVKRLGAWMIGDGNCNFQLNKTRIFEAEQAKMNAGLRPQMSVEDLTAEADSKAHNLMLIEAAVAFGLPGGGKFIPPLQAAADEFHALTVSYDIDTARMMMNEKYPYAANLIMQGTSKSTTGAASTKRDVGVLKGNPSLVAEVAALSPEDPAIVSLLFADHKYNDGGYEPISRQWLEENKVPGTNLAYQERLTTEQVAREVKVKDGWQKYTNTVTWFNVLANDMARKDPKTAKLVLAKAKRSFIDQAEVDNPEWHAEFKSNSDKINKTHSALVKIVNNDKFMKGKENDPFWNTVKAWLARRDAAKEIIGLEAGSSPTSPTEAVKTRKEQIAKLKHPYTGAKLQSELQKVKDKFTQPGTAKANWAMQQYLDATDKLRADNPQFDAVYKRWFDSEQYYGLRGK